MLWLRVAKELRPCQLGEARLTWKNHLEGAPVYVCSCHAVTERQVDASIARGATTEADVGAETGAGTGCGGCLNRICDRLARADPRHRNSQVVALSA